MAEGESHTLTGPQAHTDPLHSTLLTFTAWIEEGGVLHTHTHTLLRDWLDTLQVLHYVPLKAQQQKK